MPSGPTITLADGVLTPAPPPGQPAPQYPTLPNGQPLLIAIPQCHVPPNRRPLYYGGMIRKTN